MLLPPGNSNAPRDLAFLMDVRGDEDIPQVLRITPMPSRTCAAAQSLPAPPSPALALPSAVPQQAPQTSHLLVQYEEAEDEKPASTPWGV